MEGNRMLERTFTVWRGETDETGKMPLNRVLFHFQEAAGEDADNLSFGDGDFGGKIVWILARMQVKVNRLPRAHEKLVLKTWHCQTDKLISRRDFFITDESGAKIIVGASWWIHMNLDTRKIARMPQSLIDLNGTTDGPQFEEGNFKQPSFEGVVPAGSYEIITREEDLDSNRHVNNTHYPAWALESAPLRKEAELKELLISFKAECFAGERIAVSAYPDGENAFWHTLIRASDGRPAVSVYTRWERK